jgi:hypothetical protein
MFVSISKKFNKTNPLSKVFESRVKKVDQNDYLALLSLYLEVFNPTRKDQAADYVTKYKGKEKEMFASLANKYNACNALESPKTSTSTASIPSTLPQPTPTQKIDGGFNFFAKKEETKGSSSASGYPPLSATAPKPLGISTATKDKKETSAAAPSPFTSTSNTAGSTDTTTASQSKDYVKLLTDFYQAHNPAKVSEVSSTLEKYKVGSSIDVVSYCILPTLLIRIIQSRVRASLGKGANNVCQACSKVQNQESTGRSIDSGSSSRLNFTRWLRHLWIVSSDNIAVALWLHNCYCSAIFNCITVLLWFHNCTAIDTVSIRLHSCCTVIVNPLRFNTCSANLINTLRIDLTFWVYSRSINTSLAIQF